MSGPDDSAPYLSRPSAVAEAGARGEPEAREPASRYRDLGLLGRGGMGEVRAVHDGRLGRQVARKAARAGVPGAREALEREAAITAALEHPGIVPVYDAGHDEAGAPWYTMRMVRGRTLRAVVAETPDLAGRLGLLRAVLAATEAVAYAHARGVVHRDLKATNVLLGEHGEVQVVDWGLAGSGAGGPAGGTPATMAPEQARGEAATTTADVWGLGLILLELLTGAPAHEGVSAELLLERVAAGPPPEVPEAGVPGALRAVVQRCLRLAPEERYPDAGALALDLANFLDGRLVGAHDYTLGEHLRRLVARHRLAVAVGLLALLAMALLSAGAARRVVAERDAARAAEAVAQAALDRSDQHLAQALVLAARQAASAGWRPEAEVLAAGALALGESPEARGVLAAFGTSPRPQRSGQGVAPGRGGSWRLGPAGALCLERESVTVHPEEGEPWSLTVAAEDAAFAGGHVVLGLRGNTARVLDGRTGALRGEVSALPSAHGLVSGHRDAWQVAARSLVRLEAAGPSATVLRPCGEAVVSGVTEEPGGGVLVACGGDRLVRLDPATGDVAVLPFTLLEAGGTVRLVVAGPGELVAVGSDRGEVAILGPEGVRSRATLDSAVAGLWWTADGRRLVVGLRQGSPVVLEPLTGAVLARLPAATGAVVGRSGPSGLVFEGAAGGTWELGALRPVQLGQGAGITGVLAGTGDDVVLTRGDGSVARYARASGALLDLQAGSSRPLKGLSPLPWAEGYAVVGVEGGVRLLDAALRERDLAAPVPGRRVVPVGGELLVLRYSAPPLRLGEGSVTELLPGGTSPWFDAGADEAGLRVAGLAEDGRLWLVDEAVREAGTFPEAVAVDALAGGGAVLAEAEALVEVGARGSVRRRSLPPERVVDLAVSPDDALVALGTLGGTVRVLDRATGRTVALLEGHRERVAALTWAGPSTLLSGSWDGTARSWELGQLRTPADALVAEVERAWGLDVSEALAALEP